MTATRPQRVRSAAANPGSGPATLIVAAAEQDHSAFAAKLAGRSLEAALDVWLRRVARRTVSPAQRARLLKAVERGTAAETKDVQLTHAALLRSSGWDERAAAAAAFEAGATYTEVGTILGMSQQGASKRIKSYLDAAGEGGHQQ